MNERLTTILNELRHALETIYGERLEQVILFGSQARGDSQFGSDCLSTVWRFLTAERPCKYWLLRAMRLADIFVTLRVKILLNVDHVTKVHFLKFDLVKPIFHFRTSRRPKAL